jgi:hypothetical protein
MAEQSLLEQPLQRFDCCFLNIPQSRLVFCQQIPRGWKVISHFFFHPTHCLAVDRSTFQEIHLFWVTLSALRILCVQQDLLSDKTCRHHGPNFLWSSTDFFVEDFTIVIAGLKSLVIDLAHSNIGGGAPKHIGRDGMTCFM